jgi:hypothetical protein
MISLRILECGNSQPYPLPPIPNSGAQKKRAQMLLHGARADAQLARDFLVAAALDQQIQHLLIPWRYFHSVEVHHSSFPSVSYFGFILPIAARIVG